MVRTECPVLCVEGNDFDYRLIRLSAREHFENVKPLRAIEPSDAMWVLADAETCPALIICDPDLVAGDGLELIAQLKQQPHAFRVPFVVFSKCYSEAERVSLNKAGADACETKPECSVEFRHAVQKIIRRWTTRQRCMPKELTNWNCQSHADPGESRRELVAVRHRQHRGTGLPRHLGKNRHEQDAARKSMHISSR